MFPYIKNLTHYPYTVNNGKVLKKIFRISSMRLNISRLLLRRRIYIYINDVCVSEAPLGTNIVDSTHTNVTRNVWFYIPVTFNKEIEIKVKADIFGVGITFYTEKFFIQSHTPNYFELKSDRFLDDQIDLSSFPTNDELENIIRSIPSVVRKTYDSSDDLFQIRSIGLMRLDQLGDFILTIPSIYELHKCWPNAKITLYISPANVGAAKSLNFIDDIVEVPFSFQVNSNARSLTREAYTTISDHSSGSIYDLFIDLSPMPETRDLLGVVNANYKVGFENVFCPYLDLGIQLHSIDPCNALSNVSHSISPALLVEAVKRIFLPLHFHHNESSKSVSYLDEFGLRKSNYVVIHGGSRNILIRWPIEKYVELTERISRTTDAIVFISDDKIDENLAILLRKIDNVIIVENGLDYENFDAIISNCKIFIGNDTGPKHLAALRDIPVISLHSARTNWSEWGQLDSGYIISRRVPCSGCAITEYDQCGKELVCIRDIQVDEVVEAYQKLLKERRNSIFD